MFSQVTRANVAAVMAYMQLNAAWPFDAKFCVEYEYRSNCSLMNSEKKKKYFSNNSQLVEWLDANRNFIAESNGDFCMEYSVFEWDMAPKYLYSRTI